MHTTSVVSSAMLDRVADAIIVATQGTWDDLMDLASDGRLAGAMGDPAVMDRIPVHRLRMILWMIRQASGV
jgi:hypothetical protein